MMTFIWNAFAVIGIFWTSIALGHLSVYLRNRRRLRKQREIDALFKAFLDDVRVGSVSDLIRATEPHANESVVDDDDALFGDGEIAERDEKLLLELGDDVLQKYLREKGDR